MTADVALNLVLLPTKSTYNLVSARLTVIWNPLPVPPIVAALALNTLPLAYPEPPLMIVTSVTAPLVTVISAVAPVPLPLTLVNATPV